jgi:serine/threonine protein kinase
MSISGPWNKNWVEIEPLGGGGQGDTLLVKSISGEPARAVLKLLKPQKVRDAKARGRMAIEVTNLKVLRNAGGKVPQVLDGNTEQFEDQNVPLYFVMEFIQGDTLAKTVQGSNGLPVETSIGIALDLCSTLRVAIKSGIVHRDIKPENIIVRNLEPPDVVMVDFGLSFNEEDADHHFTSADESLDNKFLSLPERRGPDENKRDFRSDLTGICAILFYCLTKCVPRNLRDSQNRPPHRWQNYSLSGKIQNENQLSNLNLFFNRGFNHEIDTRFQTVDELSNRLEEILKPEAAAPVEDLAVVVERETAALRKNDRKTQLSLYFSNAVILQQSINQCFNDISTTLQKHNSFSVLLRDLLTGRQNIKTDQGDLIARTTIGVSVQNHSIQRYIYYAVISQGTECGIYRAIEEIVPGSPTKIIETWTLICRYDGNSVPTAFAVVADMKPTVTRTISAISQKIQSGY